MVGIEQGFPSVDSPLVMGTFGNRPPDKISPPWYRLLLTLWIRTGGAAGSAGPISGEVKMYAGPTIPSGTLECNGQAVSRTTYAALFSAIGVIWGPGDGSTTFNVPNLATPWVGVLILIKT